MPAGWSYAPIGHASGEDPAPGEQPADAFAPVELQLAAGPGGRIGAAVTGALLVGGAGTLFATQAPWRPSGPVTIWSVLSGPLLLLLVWIGVMFIGLALARPGRVRVDSDRLTVVHPALLSRPLVAPRRMVAAISVDVVRDRERRHAGRLVRWAAVRSRADLRREEQAESAGGPPWWPVDLQPYLPLLAAGVASAGQAPNASVMLSGPLRVPTRASTWLLSRLLPAVLERPPRPAKAARGFMLRFADPLAAAQVLGGWVQLRPLTTGEVAALAPARAGLRPHALAWAAVAAVLAGTLVGQGYWQTLGEAQLADVGCRALEAVLADHPGTAGSAAAGGDLAGGLPGSSFPALGFEDAAEADAPLPLERAAALEPEPAAAEAALDRHGYVRGHGRQWEREDGAHVQALVYEFPAGAAAAAFDAESARVSCRYADDAFTVAGLPDSVGLRVRTHLGIRDQVSFVRGSRRYEVRIDQPAAEDGYRSIAALAEAAARAAR